MKTLLLVALMLCAFTTKATNYYFSASGDDSRLPGQAQSPSTPWKSIDKLNAYFSSLKPGDSVLFKRGETFYGSIKVIKSGTSATPIVIGSYGTGNKPVISSLVTLTNWVSKGNGIWESSTVLPTTDVNLVLLNGAEQQMGRYPNADAANGGYLYFESHSGTTSITDNELTSATNWTGAEVVVRQRRWKLDRATITSHSGSTIKNSGVTDEPYNNYGYFIQNSLKTLDKLGEWYFNPSTSKLSVYFGSGTPTSYKVEAATIVNLLDCNNASYVVFDNLNVKGANESGFYLRGGSNINIENCDINFSGINGVTSSNHTYFKIENSTIANSYNDGIDLGYGDYAIVRNNKITNTAVVAGMGLSGDNKGIGISGTGDGDLVEYNEVRNTGYTGIYFLGDYVTIKNNLIDSFCSVKNDGGGIYTVGINHDIRKGRKITGNIILNGIGAGYGTDIPSSVSAEGIYMDNRTSGVEITNNTVSNADKGIYLHNDRYIVVRNNTFYDNNKQLNLRQDQDSVRYNVVSNNIAFSKVPSESILTLTSKLNDLNLFARFDSNFYARPLDDRLVITNNYVKNPTISVTQSLDLEGWQNKFDKDNTSKRAPRQIAPYKLNKLIGTNKITNGTYSSDVKGTSGSGCAISLGTSGTLDGGCLKVVPSARSSIVSVSAGSITAGKSYILRYSSKGAVDTSTSISIYLRQNAAPYSTVSSVAYRKAGIARSENEMIFTPSTSQTSVSVVFKADDQTNYYLDNIELYEADATITNPDDSIRFEYNASNFQKSVSLSGNYIDMHNNKYSNSVVLQPYTSVVLLRTSGVQNGAPTVSITSPATNTSFTAPTSITINATANDADGSISKVEFYNGNTLLSTDNTSPYSFTWTNVAAGNYNLTAKATDNGGLTASDAITVSVTKANEAPTVSITSPATNTSFTAPTSITINATANDADGSISKVDFYNGNTLLGSDNTSPYSFTWSNVAPGNYNLTAKATDNGGLTSSDGVTVSVIKANQVPTVSVTSPVTNTSFTAPTSITINATANDADGSISKVEFYNGNILLGSDNTSPYSFTWSNVAPGNYNLTAKATDNGGLTSSDGVTVSVIKANQAPTVSVTSPVTNASFTAPTSITINATANDADGSISKVDFYNGNTLLGSDNTSPYSFTWSNVAPGNYNLTAKATDNGGLTSSDGVTVSVIKANQAPTVSVTSPVTNASFTAPTSITINATANDADGSISKVDFYNGNTLLGSDNTSPYSFTWSNVAPGNYNLTAKATDNGGLTSSDGVTVSVIKANQAPTVSVTSPVTNASFTAPTSITINATANDADGSISKVDFYNGNTLLGSDNTSPYSFTWSNVAPGNYNLTAKATDNGGLTSSDGVTVSVIKANQAPTVSVTSPVTNTSFTAPTSITINATANDADGSISKVEFYNGNTLLGSDNTSPYTFTWSNVAPGNYAITAKATDNGGLVTSSSAITITMIKANGAPTVSLTSPVTNASFTAPASVDISATAADADGSISKVEFYNGNTLLGSDNTSPYTFTWSNVAPGNYNLTAKATDNGGLVTSSSAITITVIKANVAPTVSITSPVTNASFTAPASVDISATAADADGSISKVDFYNGNTLLGSDNTSPYTFTWSNVAPGNYNLTAKATDNGGLTSSDAITVSVIKANVAPTVSITSPVTNASFTAPASVDISATAADADGSISKVEFYNGNTLLGSDNTSPYTLIWSNVAPGNYNLTAKATDNGGLVTSSSAITITVIKANGAPTVSLISPVTNASFTAPASVDISATAADADGSISKVEFYNGNTLLGSDNTSPYTLTWSNVAPGNYNLTAKATDNGGLVTSSSAITITVIKANVAPTVSITSPVTNASFTAPASIDISATAADADGSISKVDFYNGNTLLGSDNTSPYTFTWSNVAPGNYNLTAKATDNGGLTSSDAITVSVIKANVAPTVSITSPVTNASFTAPASIDISATAADADGSISKVDFYNGNTLLGSDNTSPYTFTWSNVAPGNYNLTAKATDNGGLTSSDAITVSVVKANVAPTVSISTPVNNASFTAPASIDIIAAANDADGSIAKVEFFNGNVLLGSDSTSPYTFTWSNVAPGNYNLTAKATDNGGLTSSDAITVSVIKANEAPTVSVTSPVTNAIFTAPASIDITATANDADGSVSKVEFFNGNVLLGSDSTSPYTFTWSNVALGTYNLTAKATDNGGLTSSDAITVSVIKANVAPIVSITSPVINESFTAPASIDISATATDADGSISKVEFYNGNVLLAVKKDYPYTMTWQNVPAGSYTITAFATDNYGLTSTSQGISIVVNENIAPIVDLTSPTINTSFDARSTVDIHADASDIDGSVAKVEFYNGNTLIGTANKSPYDFNWKDVPAGNYAVTAKAIDNGGKVTSSSAVTFKVNTTDMAPAVKITYPAANAIFNAPSKININAIAEDPNGAIAKVEFYNGQTLVRTEYKFPYTCTLENLPAGDYALTAKAYDNDGLISTSESVSISVVVNTPPVVRITSPVTNTNYQSGDAVSLTADAIDTNGKIAKVEFYNGDTLLGTDRYSGYSWTWKNVSSGTYTVTAKAYDNTGLVTVSEPVIITVSSTEMARSSNAASNNLALANNDNISNLEGVSLKLGPNPASNMLSVYTKGLAKNKELKVSILSMSGMLLKTITSNTDNQVIQLNVSSLRAGLYLVKIVSENTSVYKQFEKQ